jgi:hypothetical protein
MKIIQAMKQIKDLSVKATDLREKIGKFCSDLSIETPTYPAGQAEQIASWLQSHHDILKEILRLRVAIQHTNIHTKVTIGVGGNSVTQSIAAWIHRRRDLATLEMNAWQKLSDRGLKESNVQTAQGGTITEVRIRRYFDAAIRDSKHEEFRAEPALIDGTLEVINAVTDLVEEDPLPIAAAA